MLKVDVPEGVSGDWAIERFEVTKEDSAFGLFTFGNRTPYPGEYTRLMCRREVVMSDTPAEMADHYAPVRNAKGNILINGLGLGMVLLNCMEKEGVEHATVVEYSEDVINLVWPHYKEKYGDRIEIVHADALEWKPPKGVRYGMVWHDIWTFICTDNYEDMKKLHRRYGRRTEWQGSWSREEVKYRIAQEKRSSWW